MIPSSAIGCKQVILAQVPGDGKLEKGIWPARAAQPAHF